MATKVFTFVKDSMNFRAPLPSGLGTLTNVANYRLKIKKPDGTIVVKNGTNSDLNIETSQISFLFNNGDLDQEGVYDYEFSDTTSGADRKGKLLQFTVTKEIM